MDCAFGMFGLVAGLNVGRLGVTVKSVLIKQANQPTDQPKQLTQPPQVTIVSSLEEAAASAPPSASVSLVVKEGLQVILPMAGLFDVAKETARLEKQKQKVRVGRSCLGWGGLCWSLMRLLLVANYSCVPDQMRAPSVPADPSKPPPPNKPTTPHPG